ncbi:MAG: SLATT domain-containing protein [Chloroflexi bacterium]|nr:SLATT domain-containing protein [Chloroflexota bacterium]
MSVNPIPNHLDAQPHSQEDLELLFSIYMEKRLQGQLQFYESRIRENDLNSDFTFTLGTFIMTLSSLLATISASAAIPILALISAVLPALSSLLAAFRQLYGWDRQSAIYRDAVLGLEKIRLLAPDDDRLPFSDITPIFPKVVMTSEAVFTAEVNQWGQIFTASAEQEEAQNVPRDPLARMIAAANLSDDQAAAIQSIVASGKKSGMDVQATVNTYSEVAVEMQPPADAPAAGIELTAAAETTTVLHEAAEAPPAAPTADYDMIPPQESLPDGDMPASPEYGAPPAELTQVPEMPPAEEAEAETDPELPQSGAVG